MAATKMWDDSMVEVVSAYSKSHTRRMLVNVRAKAPADE
jgi:hypothetical protein